LAYTGLFDLVEARFYRPSVIREARRTIEGDAGALQGFLGELRGRFSATLENEAVRRSFLPNQTREDILERSRIYGELMTDLGGLQSVRFIDSGAVRIHFSTDARDILRLGEGRIAYRNYHESPGFIPFERVEAPDQGEAKVTADDRENRFLFSFPFYDSYGAYRGTALFSFAARSLAERFMTEGRIPLGEDVSLLSEPAGVLIGLPRGSRGALTAAVASIWKEGAPALTTLEASGTDAALVLVSATTDGGFFIGRLMPEALFILPEALKIILLGAFFLTLYLSVFLIFNFRQDPILVIQNRLKRLRRSLVEEYYDLKGDLDWDRWRRELEQRRGEIHAELKRGIRFRPGIVAGDLDFLIDKFWDEFLAVIRGRREEERDADIETKILKVLSRVLGEVSASAAPAPFPPQGAEAGAAPRAATAEEAAGDMEEPDAELEEAAALEEVEGAEEAAGFEAGPGFVEGTEELPMLYGPSWTLEDLAGGLEFGFVRDGAGEEEPPGPPGFPLEEGELPDSVPVGYPEELSGDYRGFHLYIPFSSEAPGALELLEAVGGEAEPEDLREIEEIEGGLSPRQEAPDAVIEERDGIAYIRKSFFHSGRPLEGLDPEFQGLIDSVISGR
jgi:hypothetical protein